MKKKKEQIKRGKSPVIEVAADASVSEPLILREGPMRFGSPGLNRYETLELRCEKFARDVRAFVKLVPKSPGNVEDVPQLVRASGSIGANYIEANEALGRKDFFMRIKISRKEAKESRYWLRLMEVGDDAVAERNRLGKEATELMLIFSAIFRKGEDG